MTKICQHPFKTIQIQNTGEVYCCCCYWTDFYSFGNIFDSSFEEIWNGQKAQDFRRQFIDNNFSFCKTDVCDPAFEDITPTLTVPFPKRIEFSYDRHCNVRCIFCRTQSDNQEELHNRLKEKRIEDNFDSIFTPVIQHAELVELNSAGELFASKHSIDIVKKIIKINPNIQFRIISNGILFSKKNTQALDLENRLNSAIISIHSASKNTYDKLVKNGNFNAVIDNARYLANLKNLGKLQTLQLNFVVTALNYKDMKNFVKFAKDINAKAFFINYHRQIDSDSLQSLLDISLPSHPKYNELVEILSDPIFNDEHCVVNDYLKNLKPSNPSLFQRLKHLFKK